MDAREVAATVTLDPAWVAQMQQNWNELMALLMWGEVKSSRLGAMSRVRKKALDLGEKMRSLSNSREWIPHPREQLKNALGSSFNLRDALLQFERGAQDVDGGGDLDQFNALVVQLHRTLLEPLEPLESNWARLLDSQLSENPDED